MTLRVPITITIGLIEHTSAGGPFRAHITGWGVSATGEYGSLWIRDLILEGTTPRSAPRNVLGALAGVLEEMCLREVERGGERRGDSPGPPVLGIGNAVRFERQDGAGEGVPL